MESFPAPHSQTNPYSVQLFRSFPPEVDASYFSWIGAIRGDYDVFHLHWPEVFVRSVSGPKSLIRGALFLLILIRIRIGKKALVRTLHDQVPHEPPNFLQKWLIELSERWTTLWIVLSSASEAPEGALSRRSTIGHFENWFEPIEIAPVPGRLLHFGLVRRYKGVDTLVRAFQELDDPALSLRIVGTVQDEDLERTITEACAADSRITADCNYVSDEVLRSEVLSSSLVVLPFSRITNSSSLVLALSLQRPVLAPSAPSILEIAEEVGPGWVYLYDDTLAPADIETALRQVRDCPPSQPPDLSLRDWTRIGHDHAEAFEFAYASVRSSTRAKT